jgi:hypothetical protein
MTIFQSGIETATQDLQKENAERVWQEGILRQMPVVGSLVNWWSPLSKETGIKGRSLNLTAGKLLISEYFSGYFYDPLFFYLLFKILIVLLIPKADSL